MEGMEYVEKLLEVGYRELAFKSSRQLEPSLLMAYPCRVSVQIAGLEKKVSQFPSQFEFPKAFLHFGTGIFSRKEIGIKSQFCSSFSDLGQHISEKKM